MDTDSADKHFCESEHFPKKKRQRTTVVCTNCKKRKIKCDRKRPACSNCSVANVAEYCQYVQPNWALENNDEPKSNNDMKLEFLTKQMEYVYKKMENVERLLGGNSLYSDTNPMTLRSSNSSSGSACSASTLAMLGLPSQETDNFHTDRIDFFQSYSSLEIKRSASTDFKPLTTTALYNKDVFIRLLHSHFKVSKSLLKSLKKNEAKAEEKHVAKSVIHAINMTNPTEENKQRIRNFNDQRRGTLDTLPIFPTFTSTSNNREKDFQEFLDQEILDKMPTKYVVDRYFEIFWQNIYPLIPILERSEFENDLKRILQWDKATGELIEVRATKTYDYALLATFLIIIRFSYVTIVAKLQPFEEDKMILNKYPISVDFISLTYSCLSNYRFLRRTKFKVLQALVFLRHYLLFAPEDGDGVDMAQSQILYSMIVQSAYTIALNRDPTSFPELAQDNRKVQLYRKMWYAIVTLDRKISTITGIPCIIQNSENLCNTKAPDPNDLDPVENRISELTRPISQIDELCGKVINLINQVNSPPRVNDILQLLNQIDYTVQLNRLDMHSMKPFAMETAVQDNLTNFRILEKNLVIKTMKLMIRHSLTIHYENEEHLDIWKASNFFFQTLKGAVDIANICYKFLSGQYDSHLHSGYQFHVNRVCEAAVERCCLILCSLALRCLHAKKMFQTREDFQQDEQLQCITAEIHELLMKNYNELASILFNKLGAKYYQSFKALAMLRFFFRILNNPEDSVIGSIFDLLSNPKAQEAYKEDFKKEFEEEDKPAVFDLLDEWSLAGKAPMHLRYANILASFSKQDFCQILEILKESVVLKSPIYEFNKDNKANTNSHSQFIVVSHHSPRSILNSADTNKSDSNYVPSLLYSEDKVIKDLIPGPMSDEIELQNNFFESRDFYDELRSFEWIFNFPNNDDGTHR